MAVTVDVYGSCVSSDLFRYVGSGKYQFSRCVTQVPITTLYEKGLAFQDKNIEAMHMEDYEKTMFRVQTTKILPKLLKKNKSDFLILDLADELMERCEIQAEGTGQLAQIEGKEEEYDQLLQKELKYTLVGRYSPFDMDLRTVERKYRKFASDILYSEKNPDGYRPEQIVIIEALYAADIMGNDGNIHPHDKKYKIKESNEWLRKLYGILEKYMPGCHVIKLPEFTHSTQNHLNGLHPLHYMADIYYYFERAMDVICRYSRVNTVENLWREQSLKNKLETRASNSAMMYGLKNQIAELQKNLKNLENIIRA